MNIKRSGSTGTREWSDVSHNIGIGCSHDCLYCYAAANALERGIITNRDNWMKEKLTPRKIPSKDGLIMFPTAHDITPFYLEQSLEVVRDMLNAGRNILIVTKAHLECITAICEEVRQHKDYYEKVLIRITIGSLDETICKIWEPGAPSPAERLEALRYAFLNIIRTSVSIEPMLRGPIEVAEVIKAVDPFVSEDIWIGKMNSLERRLHLPDELKIELIKTIRDAQCDENILALYDALKHNSKIKWKDSIREVVNRLSK